MKPSLAERIASRIEHLETNPSNVALEAGLGRSAVRDILVGKVENPRIDTLRKLTAPLSCSLDYLTGNSEDPGTPGRVVASQTYLDPREIMALIPLEVGVFRKGSVRIREAAEVEWSEGNDGSRDLVPTARYMLYNDARLPGWRTELYRVNDQSLRDLGIARGDVATVATPSEGSIIPLKNGTIVIAMHTLSQGDLTETSARQVEVIGNEFRLASRGRSAIPPIIIRSEEADSISIMENMYFTTEGIVSIEGILVRITRDYPV